MAFCENCGREYHEGSKFCNRCGAALPAPEQYTPSAGNMNPVPVQQPVYQNAQTGMQRTYAPAPTPVPQQAVQVPYAPAPPPVSQPAPGGSKPWEADNRSASPKNTDLSTPMIFPISPVLLNKKRTATIMWVINIIIDFILIIFFSSKISDLENPARWYSSVSDDISFYKFIRTCFIIMMIAEIYAVIMYFVQKDGVEKSRIEVFDTGINLNYQSYFSFRAVQVVWQNIVFVDVKNVFSLSDIIIKYRDPYSQTIKTARLAIENTYTCADIIREKTGLRR